MEKGKTQSGSLLPDGFELDAPAYLFVASNQSETLRHRSRSNEAIGGILGVSTGELGCNGGYLGCDRFHNDT
jgi:hypothetical protein